LFPHFTDLVVLSRPVLVQIWLGGNENQTRLAELYTDRLKVKDLDTFLEPLFAAYAAGRKTKSERFGDWAGRIGLKAVKAAHDAAKAAAAPAAAAPGSNGHAEASSNGNGVVAPKAAAKTARVGGGSNGASTATATLTKPAAVDTAALAALEAAAKAQGMTAAQYAAYLASQLSSGAPSQ
jgi:hypothetical protein